MFWFGLNRCHLYIVCSHYVSSAAYMLTRARSKSQQCNSGYYKAGTDCLLHCHCRVRAITLTVARLDSCSSQSDIHQPSICLVCKYSTIIQIDCVYLAHQSDGAVFSNLEWEKLAEVGACGGQKQESSLKVNYLWTRIAWTQQTCCFFISFDCFASCMRSYTSKLDGVFFVLFSWQFTTKGCVFSFKGTGSFLSPSLLSD